MVNFSKFNLFLLLIFISFSVIANDQKMRGLILEVSEKEIVSDKKLLKFLKKNKIKPGIFSEVLNVWVLGFEKKLSKTESLFICRQLKKFKEVMSCEIDLMLVTQEVQPKCRSLNESAVIDDAIGSFKDGIFIPCKLFKKERSLELADGLSPYWAQEMTGADLVREKLKALSISDLPPNLIGIWDSPEDQHGELVSGLISSKEDTALIPLGNRIPYKNLLFSSDYVSNYEHFRFECKMKGGCSKYINNSMKWHGSPIVGNIMSSISDDGSVIVVAAGNSERLIDPEMTKQSANQKVLLVTSIDPSGLPSEFTSFGAEALISAPSDNLIMSSNFKGKKRKFGGTSGAAPQVTASLAAFTLETGYDLTLEEAKRVLKRTALDFPKLPTPNLLGNGILNSLKISELATKLNENCRTINEKSACIKDLLKGDEVFNFVDKNQEVLEEAKHVFPFCSEGKTKIEYPVDCEKQKILFRKIRKEALLNPRTGSWAFISCIYKMSGFYRNAEFYDEMENLKGKSNHEVQESFDLSLKEGRYLIYLTGKDSYSPQLERYIVANIKTIPSYQRNTLLSVVTTLNGEALLKKLLVKEDTDLDLYRDIATTVANSEPKVKNVEEYLNVLLNVKKPGRDLLVSILDIIKKNDVSEEKRLKIFDSILDNKSQDGYVLSVLVDTIEKNESEFEIDRIYYEKVLNHPSNNYSLASGVVEALRKYPDNVRGSEEVVKKAISAGARGVFLIKALVEMNQYFPSRESIIQDQIKKNELEDHQLEILLNDVKRSESLSEKEKLEISKTIKIKRESLEK